MKFVAKFRAALAALVLLTPLPALAQTVVQVPSAVTAHNVFDLGNGPTELRVLQGNMGVFTAQSTGTSGNATSSSTALTTTATPATPPCVGCIISGTGITSGTTVSATSGTSITLSAAASVATATTLSWGAACPGAPPSAPLALIQAAVGSDLPMYTQARVCAYGGNGPGALYAQFAIGAH